MKLCVLRRKIRRRCPPNEIIDLVKSYVVLAYGETEEFVEILSLAHIDHIVRNLDWLEVTVKSNAKIKKAERVILEELVGDFFADDVKKYNLFLKILSNDSKVKADEAIRLIAATISRFKSMRKDVFYNNGLNSEDLEKLFDRVGFDTINRFIDLRNDLNILTFKRCRFAHTGIRNSNSEIQANMPDTIAVSYDPLAKEETKKISQIARHLTDFVDKLVLLPSTV